MISLVLLLLLALLSLSPQGADAWARSEPCSRSATWMRGEPYKQMKVDRFSEDSTACKIELVDRATGAPLLNSGFSVLGSLFYFASTGQQVSIKVTSASAKSGMGIKVAMLGIGGDLVVTAGEGGKLSPSSTSEEVRCVDFDKKRHEGEVQLQQMPPPPPNFGGAGQQQQPEHFVFRALCGDKHEMHIADEVHLFRQLTPQEVLEQMTTHGGGGGGLLTPAPTTAASSPSSSPTFAPTTSTASPSAAPTALIKPSSSGSGASVVLVGLGLLCACGGVGALVRRRRRRVRITKHSEQGGIDYMSADATDDGDGGGVRIEGITVPGSAGMLAAVNQDEESLQTSLLNQGSATAASGSGAVKVSRAELAASANLTVFNGGVYDFTDYLDDHPGGREIILAAGKDITLEFNEQGHTKKAIKMLREYYVGEVE